MFSSVSRWIMKAVNRDKYNLVFQWFLEPKSAYYHPSRYITLRMRLTKTTFSLPVTISYGINLRI